MTAESMLQVWGLRVAGGRFTNPHKLSTGNKAGSDDEFQLVCWVERVEGFWDVRPLLVRVYVEYRPLSAYADKQRLWEFKLRMERDLKERPFRPIRGPEEEDAADVAAQVAEEVDRRTA